MAGDGRATLREVNLLNRFFPFLISLTKELNALPLERTLFYQEAGREKIDS